MGWRFRHSFKIIPGVRLNLSKSGLSASIGGTPFTLNVGPRGVMGTASIPGTGISYRQHFGSVPQTDASSPSLPAPAPSGMEPDVTPDAPLFPLTPLPASGAPIEEIHSASTELLTSESLKELKKLMQMTFEEREDISGQLETARPAKQRAVRRYESWERGFLFKRLFKSAFAKRQTDAETETAKVAELEEQLRLTAVATHIDISKEQAEPYFQMRDAFAALCECAPFGTSKAVRQSTSSMNAQSPQRVLTGSAFRSASEAAT
jgi:hypothetical protein